MPIPVVESFTQNTVVSATSITLTRPTGVNVNDLLIINCGCDDSTSNLRWTTIPTGFTALYGEVASTDADAHIIAWFRIADGTEGATINVAHITSDDLWGGYIRVSGADTTTPIDVVGTGDIQAFSVTSHAISSVTTTVIDCLAFYGLTFDGGDGNPFTVAGTGWSESDEGNSGSGAGNVGFCWGTRGVAAIGATGDATVTSSVADTSVANQFAIRGAAAVGGVNPALLARRRTGMRYY